MDFTPDEIKRFEARRQLEMRQTSQPRGGGLQVAASPFGYKPTKAPVSTQKRATAPTWQRLIQEGGATGGAVGGAAIGTALLPGIGTIAGAGIGGLLGSFGGDIAESAVRKDMDFDLGRATKNAALDGVLSAGPLKLLKGGATAAKAAKGGSTLAQALKAGGDDAAKFTLRGAVGRKATDKADDVAIRALRLNPGQLTGVQKRTGKDALNILKTNKLLGAAPDVVDDRLVKLNDEFGLLLNKTPNVTVGDVRKQIQNNAKQFLDEPVPSIQAVGQRILDTGKQTLDNLGDDATELSAKELNRIKSLFAKEVNYNKVALDPDLADVNKSLADSLRTAIYDKSGNDKLKKLGLQIRDLTEVSTAAAKQANLGRGSGPISLRTGIMGGVGAGVGAGAGSAIPGVGPLAGAALTGLATGAINSPAGLRVGTKALAGAGNKLAQSSAKASTAKGIAQNAVKNLTLTDALQGGLGYQSDGNQSDSMAMGTAMNIPNSNTSMQPQYNSFDQTQNAGVQNQSGITTEKLQMVAMQMLQQGASPDEIGEVVNYLNTIKSIQDGTAFMSEAEREAMANGGGADLSQSSRTALASSDNAINTVNQLEDMFTSAGGGSGRLGGSLKNFAGDIGFDENVNIYNSLANASVVQIAKALAGPGGGTVSDMDAKVIIDAMPTIRDTPTEARAKFTALRQRLQNAKENTLLYGGTEDVQSLQVQ